MCSLHFFCNLRVLIAKMVGAAAYDAEMLLGYTADGMFEIVLTPGKFFFQKKIFFYSNFVLSQIFY